MISSLPSRALSAAPRGGGTRRFSTAIVGAGFSGLIAALDLKRKGIEDFTIFESAERIGGTWHKNTYPGVACDTPAPAYSIQGVPANWSGERPSGGEIRQYLEDTATTHGLMKHIRFNTDVEQAVWDENAKAWKVATLEKTKKRSEVGEFRSVISAVGQLNVPKVPPYEGLSAFRGEVFHTAEWDHGVSLKGKRVGMVGAGPSALQVAPFIAEEAKELVLIQRSVPYVVSHLYEKWSEEKQELHRKDPSKLEDIRAAQFAEMEEMYPAMFLGEANTLMAEEIKTSMRAALPPSLHAQAIPDYPVATKRMGFSPKVFTPEGVESNVYFETLKRPNVDLLRGSVVRVEPDGVRVATKMEEKDQFLDLDVLIMATGFHSTKFVHPMQVVGARGESLDEAWNGVPRGFYGMMMPHFPNFYMVYGPGTNLGQNTVLYNIESSARYIAQCVALVESESHQHQRRCEKVEVSEEAMDAYYKEYRAELAKTAWAVEGVDSWYKTAKGVVVNQSPYSVVEYARRTASVNEEDLVLS